MKGYKLLFGVLKVKMPLFKLIFLCISLALVTSCGYSGDAGEIGDVIKSVHNSSGIVATITRSGGGATTGFAYHVYVGARSSASHFNEILLADKIQNLTASWNNDKLTIKMECGRIFRYTNFVDLLNENGRLYREITVELIDPNVCIQT
jgi:hypothetical protein